LRSTERIQRLTNSLLDIKRLEAGQPLGDRVLAIPGELIKEAVDTVSPVAENKQQKINILSLPELPLVMVDAEMIRRVLINLLENAVKFTSSGGTIQINAQQEGNWLKVWVQDNGPGIPVSEHERIFDKFTRLNAKDSSKGLGLGLAYCRMAMQGHGGRIWVESEPGAGSHFVFTLPVMNEDASDLSGQ
jgi:signal transduction histidine kinase